MTSYLCCADVAGSFIPPDMLLSCLQSKSVHFFSICISKSQGKCCFCYFKFQYFKALGSLHTNLKLVNYPQGQKGAGQNKV